MVCGSEQPLLAESHKPTSDNHLSHNPAGYILSNTNIYLTTWDVRWPDEPQAPIIGKKHSLRCQRFHLRVYLRKLNEERGTWQSTGCDDTVTAGRMPSVLANHHDDVILMPLHTHTRKLARTHKHALGTCW